MITGKKEKYSGIATLFEKIELKNFFSNYLYFIIGTEILIFLVSFLGNIGPNKGPFPWKFYFYVSFITPVAITFLLGILILAFNHFVFGNISLNAQINQEENKESEEKSNLLKINSFLLYMKQVPFLPILFIIIVSAVLLYKLDAIFLFIFNAGEKVITYILIGSGVILSAIMIFGIIWIFINYKLSKKQIENEYKYRNEIMNKLGFLILNKNTVINKEGKILTKKKTLELEILNNNIHNNDKIKTLPPYL